MRDGQEFLLEKHEILRKIRILNFAQNLERFSTTTRHVGKIMGSKLAERHAHEILQTQRHPAYLLVVPATSRQIDAPHKGDKLPALSVLPWRVADDILLVVRELHLLPLALKQGSSIRVVAGHAH